MLKKNKKSSLFIFAEFERRLAYGKKYETGKWIPGQTQR